MTHTKEEEEEEKKSDSQTSSNSDSVHTQPRPMDSTGSNQNLSNKQFLLLSKIQAKSHALSVAHETGRAWNSKVSRWLSYPTTFCTSLGTFFTGLDNNKFYTIILLLGGISVGLSALSSSGKYNNEAANHHEASLNFTSLANEIEIFLNTAVSEESLIDYLNRTNERFHFYQQHSPTLHKDFFANNLKQPCEDP